MDYRKSEKRRIENLARDVDLIEMNVKGEAEMLQAHRDGDSLRAAAVTVKYGCKDFAEQSVDEIMDALPRRTVQELSQAILDLSGGDAKNSESTPSESSSSD